jgi:hypothetical protein
MYKAGDDAAIERRLRSLRALADRPGTPGEGAAAEAAIKRLEAKAPPLVPVDPLIGLVLALDRSCDRIHACCRTPSGSHVGVLEAGSGPHGCAIRCSLCGKHRGWLPRAAAEVLRLLWSDGRLSALPTLRDRSIKP